MVDNALIKQMLKKADAHPFYFGGDNHSYFWRVAEICGEIYAERTHVDGESNETQASYSYCLAFDKNNREGIYCDIVIDFVMYYRDFWYYHIENTAFSDVASCYDEGLLEILDVFNKSYAEFISDVLYWFSISLEVEIDEKLETYKFKDPSRLSSNARLAKKVIDRFSEGVPIVVEVGDTTFLWEAINMRNEIWFKREVQRDHGEYIYITDEWGRVPLDDSDALESFRDAVRSCFYIDGWKIIETENNLGDFLKVAGVNLDEITA